MIKKGQAEEISVPLYPDLPETILESIEEVDITVFCFCFKFAMSLSCLSSTVTVVALGNLFTASNGHQPTCNLQLARMINQQTINDSNLLL